VLQVLCRHRASTKKRVETMHELPEIPHDCLVLVGDGRKAMILRNLGAQRRLKFEALRVFEHATPPTHEIGTDRPGRSVAGAGENRNAYEETDWHHLEESRFVHSVEEALTRALKDQPQAQFVVVLPPKWLGEFRANMSASLKSHLIGEVAKDLTHHTVPNIERLLRQPDAAG
jgi:protein required for attachment to host cells